MKSTEVSFRVILRQVLHLEVAKGHLKWKVSDLSRLTGVSRPLIYYHLGKTKREILNTCLELVTVELYGFGRKEKDLNEFGERMLDSWRYLSRNPGLTLFYLKGRATNSPLQKRFVEIEKRFQRKLREHLPGLDETRIEATHALLHGIVTAPFLNESSARAALEVIGLPTKASSAKSNP